MKTLFTALAALTLVAAGSVQADEELSKKNKCNTCHDVSAKKIGPTWKDIAAKADKAAILAAIEKGSKNKYGKIPMPPQPNAKADAEALAKWIISLK
jgi:cytochrome c